MSRRRRWRSRFVCWRGWRRIVGRWGRRGSSWLGMLVCVLDNRDSTDTYVKTSFHFEQRQL
jgi:hypothetical protein